VTVPGVLVDANSPGARERKRAEAIYDDLIKKGADPSEFKFEFKAYKLQEVKDKLHELFHGKCAYCESRYAATQPMDVEHWRPKGLVFENGKEVMNPGYYWLAANWENLFPACIDCNRAREQQVPGEPDQRLLGKANQFPIADEANRWKNRRDTNVEMPLLLNPCHDTPGTHLRFISEGVVQARQESSGLPSRQGAASIEVYALNRNQLVWDRCEVLRQIMFRMSSIRTLAEILDELTSRPTRLRLKKQIGLEMVELRRYMGPSQPFSLMASQLIDEFIQDFKN
jgi:uncharacterized protein (TIGR02646 family)